jgi:hypothetical protein
MYKPQLEQLEVETLGFPANEDVAPPSVDLLALDPPSPRKDTDDS